MNTMPTAKDFALSPFCFTKIHLFVMDEHVFVMSKHLMDKQQQLFNKQKHLSDSKQHLATSNMKDGQEARELFIIRAVPTFFRSIQKTSKPLLAGFYTPLYPFW